MPGSVPFVDNDLLSSLVETLLGFEHLFDTRISGVSRVAGRWNSPGDALGLAGWRDRKPAFLLTIFVHLFLQTNLRKWRLAVIKTKMSAKTIALAEGVCRNRGDGSKCLQEQVSGGGRSAEGAGYFLGSPRPAP